MNVLKHFSLSMVVFFIGQFNVDLQIIHSPGVSLGSQKFVREKRASLFVIDKGKSKEY